MKEECDADCVTHYAMLLTMLTSNGNIAKVMFSKCL